MDSNNLTVLRGVVSSPPRERVLSSGTTVTNVEVTTVVGDLRHSVPVVVYDRAVSVGEGDDVVVAGSVVRRFFRAGGATASRTEVVAERLVPARQTRRAARLVDDALAALTG